MGHTKEKLREKKPAYGLWITIPSPVVIEVLQGGFFDWLAIDLEHAPFDNRTIYEMIRASNGTTDILARLPSCNPDIAKQVLDAGFDGIIIPNVWGIAQAKLAKSMARYQPEGTRSTAICRANSHGGNFGNYRSKHNDKVIVVIMVEDVRALGQEDVLARESMADAVLIGRYDLSASMGIPAQFGNPHFKDAFLACKERIEPVCAPGALLTDVDPDLVTEYKEMGFTFIGCGLDTEMLRFAAKRAIPKPWNPR